MRLLAMAVLAVSVSAHGTDVIRQVNGKCPTGWYKSGDFCKPFPSTRERGTQAIAAGKGRECPIGWYRVGGHCKSYRTREVKR